MKTFLLLSLVMLNLFLHHGANAQAPPWLWAKSAGGTSIDYGQSIATDASGNVYVTGYFESPTITFGPFTLTNAGADDFFIVKYDGSGNVLWAKSAGGTSIDYGIGIAIDASGNVYVTGSFAVSSITFDTVTVTNAGFSDIFIVKYDGSGNVLWAKSQGGSSFEDAFGIATDASGNVYVTGKFRSSSITFGSYTITNLTPSTYDIFAVKYDGNGNVLWAKSAGGTANDYGQGIAADASGNAYVTGFFMSPSVSFGSTTLTNAGSATMDIFIVKYDGSGNAQWAKSAGGSPADAGNGIATDASGNVYVTGYSNSSPITFGSFSLTNPGVFIVKYDGNGNALWANSEGGTSYEIGYGLATDAGRNVYLTGSFQGASLTIGSTTLTNAGLSDIFIVKYDSSGTALWAKSAGGTDADVGLGITTGSGSVYVTGYYNSASIPFGSDTLTNAASGTGDIFTAKLDGVVGITENNSPDAVTVFPNPASGELRIQSEELRIESIEIYNVVGEKILRCPVNGANKIVIDVSVIPSAIYFVAVRDEKNNLVTRKIVKM